MSRVFLIVFGLLFIVGCGGESGASEGAAGSGGSGTPSGLASLGIDPLGRGDGIDITESNYTGRCYEDDELEANRPMLPDPRQVAADEAEATARASAADAARDALADAKDAFEGSFVPEVAPMPDRSLAGDFLLERARSREGRDRGCVSSRARTPDPGKNHHMERHSREPKPDFQVAWRKLCRQPRVYVR